MRLLCGHLRKRATFDTMFDLFSTWKAKCPIFKALVAGFRGFSLPTKIGHLVFQAMLFSLLPLYSFFQTKGPGNTWFSIDNSASRKPLE